MSKFTAGTYVRCMDAEDAATTPREDSLVEGRVYCVAPKSYSRSVTLRGQAERNWREDRFELATDFKPGDHARIDTADNLHKGMEGRVVEVESAERGVVEGGVDWRLVRFKGDKGGLHAYRFSHAGHDTPLTPLNEKPLPSSPSKATEAPSSSSLEKYVPKVGDRVRVVGGGGSWVSRMEDYRGRVYRVREATREPLGCHTGPDRYHLEGCDSWFFDAEALSLVERAPEEKPLMLPAKDSSSCSSLALEALREELRTCREERDGQREAARINAESRDDWHRHFERVSGEWARERLALGVAHDERDAARNALSLSVAEVDALKRSLENYKKAQPKPSFMEKTWGFAADGVAVLSAAVVVFFYFAAFVPASFCKEKAVGLWGLACSAGSWVKGKASAVRGWVNAKDSMGGMRAGPYFLTAILGVAAPYAMAWSCVVLDWEWFRHERAAERVETLPPEMLRISDDYVKALNGKAPKPVERCGYAVTFRNNVPVAYTSSPSVPYGQMSIRCVCGGEFTGLSKHVCGEAPKATKGRWF